MKRWLIYIIVLLTIVRSTGAQQAPSPTEIDAAIDRAKAYLYKNQKNGIWEDSATSPGDTSDNSPNKGQWGGSTAMATYALLVSGEKPTDERIQKSLDFLYKANITGTYALGMRCMVWLNMPQLDKVKVGIRKDLATLRGSMKSETMKQQKGLPFSGLWDYSQIGKTYSLSRAQYAALGLWAGGQLNVDQPPEIWQNIERTWIAAQFADGGWSYKFQEDTQHPTTVGMTAAALATLYLIQDYTQAETFADPHGNPKSEVLDRGLNFIISKFETNVCVEGRFPDREYPYPQLYALERVGLSSGFRRYGNIDWYARGAAWLIKHQGRDGAFSAHDGDGEVGDTCFGLLFLQRGRTPVAFNKLDYSSASIDPTKALWNQRPRDMSKLTRWISKNIERELRWQIVTLDDTADALLEAPVLYISGQNELNLKPEGKAKLKRYLDLGGMIVANADASSAKFSASVQKLAAELYPQFEWRELPAESPIYTNQVYKRNSWKTKPAVKAIGNGVRELMVLLPTADVARAFQLNRINGREEQWQLMMNLLTYTVDRTNFRRRGESNLVVAQTGEFKRTIKVGHIIYSGVWNPEPTILEMLGRFSLNEVGTKLDLSAVKPTDNLDGISLLYMTGTRAFTFDEPSRKAIKSYIDKGGTLVVDAAGGNTAFAASAEAELGSIFGATALKPINPDHPLIDKLTKIDYRPYNLASIPNPAKINLKIIDINGRAGVIFSPQDLTAGMIGLSHDGITGYTPTTARTLWTKIIASIK